MDDGSRDATGERLAALEAELGPRLRVVRHERNRGYGAALRSGFAAAEGDLVFYTDSDNQFDLSELASATSADARVGRRPRLSHRPQGRAPAADDLLGVQPSLLLGVRPVRPRPQLLVQAVPRARCCARCPWRPTTSSSTPSWSCACTAAGFRYVERGVTHLPRLAGRSTVRLSDIPRTLAGRGAHAGRAQLRAAALTGAKPRARGGRWMPPASGRAAAGRRPARAPRRSSSPPPIRSMRPVAVDFGSSLAGSRFLARPLPGRRRASAGRTGRARSRSPARAPAGRCASTRSSPPGARAARRPPRFGSARRRERRRGAGPGAGRAQPDRDHRRPRRAATVERPPRIRHVRPRPRRPTDARACACTRCASRPVGGTFAPGLPPLRPAAVGGGRRAARVRDRRAGRRRARPGSRPPRRPPRRWPRRRSASSRPARWTVWLLPAAIAVEAVAAAGLVAAVPQHVRGLGGVIVRRRAAALAAARTLDARPLGRAGGLGAAGTVLAYRLQPVVVIPMASGRETAFEDGLGSFDSRDGVRFRHVARGAPPRPAGSRRRRVARRRDRGRARARRRPLAPRGRGRRRGGGAARARVVAHEMHGARSHRMAVRARPYVPRLAARRHLAARGPGGPRERLALPAHRRRW